MPKFTIALTVISVAATCIGTTIAVMEYLDDDQAIVRTTPGGASNHSIAISNGSGTAISNSVNSTVTTINDNRISAEGNSVVIGQGANINIKPSRNQVD